MHEGCSFVSQSFHAVTPPLAFSTRIYRPLFLIFLLLFLNSFHSSMVDSSSSFDNVRSEYLHFLLLLPTPSASICRRAFEGGGGRGGGG